VESLLHALAHHVALAVESIAIVIIAFGSARALAGIVRIALSPSRQRELSSRVITLEHGHWLIAGLTMFLSYFSDLEMERTRRQMQVSAPLRM
jgi:uncharacterized membrane protein